MNARFSNMILCAMMLSLLMLPLAMGPASATDLEKQGVVMYGNYEQITVGIWNTPTDLHFKVTANASIDVYVLTSSEFISYASGSFTPVKAVENTMNADFKIRSTIGEDYILIIDNRDNGRTGNAIPKGEISYTATYPDFMGSPADTVNNFFNTCMISVIVGVVVVIVIIILIIYFLARKKPEPQPPVVMVPVAQAPYVPPPQAPASPYEPPPPDYQPPPQGQQYPPNPPHY